MARVNYDRTRRLSPTTHMLDLVFAAALLLAPAQETPAVPVERAPLDRVVILGASVSAGAGTATELEVRRDVGLGTFLAATWSASPETPPAPESAKPLSPASKAAKRRMEKFDSKRR